MTTNTKQSPAKRWLLALGAIVLVIAALAAFKVQEIMGAIAFAQSFPEPSETVEVHVVEGAHYQPVQKVYAEVVAPRRLELRTELTGVVAEVGFAAGAAVEPTSVAAVAVEPTSVAAVAAEPTSVAAVAAIAAVAAAPTVLAGCDSGAARRGHAAGGGGCGGRTAS